MLTPAERQRIINQGASVSVPAEVHRAGPTYGGRNTPAQVQADRADLAGAAARDAGAMIQNTRVIAPQHEGALTRAADAITQTTNADYDRWLRSILDDQ